MELSLSIIIIHYNVYTELVNCIKSIYNTFTGFSYEIIVIDNCSPDRDIENLSILYPEIKITLLKKNVGFSAANNFAADQAAGKYLLILNPDTILIDNFILYLINELNNSVKIGAAAPMLVNEDLSYQNSSGSQMGLLYDFMEATFLIHVWRKLFEKMIIQNPERKYKRGWVSAACVIIPKELFFKINGFDEKYFLNYEDIDLCRKITDQGLQVQLYPMYKCIHLDHKSFKGRYDLLVLSRYKSRLLYYEKYYNSFNKKIAQCIHIAGIVIRLLLSVFFFNKTERNPRIAGYKAALWIYIKSIFAGSK